MCRLGCHTAGTDVLSLWDGAASVAVRMCRLTALHWASLNGKTETAMALVKAGADVHCTDNFGYGFSGCFLVSLVCHSAGLDGPSSRTALHACLVGCAGGRRCTMRR